MNNGIQGKSRNDRFTWQLMQLHNCFRIHPARTLFFLLQPTVPAHRPAGISFRYITPIYCVQWRLGWEAGYRTTSRYTRRLEYTSLRRPICLIQRITTVIILGNQFVSRRTSINIQPNPLSHPENVKILQTYLSSSYLLSVQAIIAPRFENNINTQQTQLRFDRPYTTPCYPLRLFLFGVRLSSRISPSLVLLVRHFLCQHRFSILVD